MLSRAQSTGLSFPAAQRKQPASFKTVVKECDGSRVVLQVDFSENATINYCKPARDPISSLESWPGDPFHSSRMDKSDTCSMVIVSDDLNYMKQSVYVFVFMQRILTHMKASYPGIETIDIFSDSPTSQFKQRFFKLTWFRNVARFEDPLEFLCDISQQGIVFELMLMGMILLVLDTTDSTECRRCQIRICTDPNEDEGGERTA